MRPAAAAFVRRLRAIAAGEIRRPVRPCPNCGDAAAISRAAHALLDGAPAILRDDLAVALFGRKARQKWTAAPDRYLAPMEMTQRCGMLVRQRYTEDRLAAAIRDGVTQYVILAAGLDSSSQRCAGLPDDFRIFEVDREAVQHWKRALLKYYGFGRHPAVAYVAVDFERQVLFEQLVEEGYDPARPAFFSWLGCTQYLQEETVYHVLESIVLNSAPGSTVVFDYKLPPALLGGEDAAYMERMLARGPRAGKPPWHSVFEPAVLEARLEGMGFAGATSLGPDQAAARYLGLRSDGMQFPAWMRILRADIPADHAVGGPGSVSCPWRRG